jgi:streptomycin 6-kinase
MEIPPSFADKIRGALGETGEVWLRDLPSLVDDLSRRWGATIDAPFKLSYNYVAPARLRDGSDAVIKIGAPWEDGELTREIRALRLYDGYGSCRLFESDLDRQAMLLERLRPGEMLLEVAASDDDAATRIGAEVMRRLWRPVAELPDPGLFKPLAEWFAAFPRHRAAYGGPGPFPAAVLERAEAVTSELLASVPGEVLLHGDFHHYNVLSSERASWLAIDPKGMLGDPGYEVGPFLLNPDIGTSVKSPALLRRRLDILAAELQYDRQRLRDWGIAHAVLSACWSAENPGDDWRPAIAAAENLIGD